MEKLAYDERIVNFLGRSFVWIAAGALAVMMFLVGANVILRPFGLPIYGTFEMVGFLGATLASFGVVYTTAQRTHLTIETVLSRIPQRVLPVILPIYCFLSIPVFLVIAWQLVRYGMKLSQHGQLSETLRAPMDPILYAVGFAFGVATLVLLIQFIRMVWK